MLKMKKIALCAALASLSVATVVGFASCAGAVGPAGPKGDKGDKGDQGIQGEAGKDGVDGVDGIGFEWNEAHGQWELVLSPWTDTKDGVILVANKTTNNVEAQFKTAGHDIVKGITWAEEYDANRAAKDYVTVDIHCTHDDHEESTLKITSVNVDVVEKVDSTCAVAGTYKLAVAIAWELDGEAQDVITENKTYVIPTKDHKFETAEWSIGEDKFGNEAYVIKCEYEEEATAIAIPKDPIKMADLTKDENGDYWYGIYWKAVEMTAATTDAEGSVTLQFVDKNGKLPAIAKTYKVTIDKLDVEWGVWQAATGNYAWVCYSSNSNQIKFAVDDAERDEFIKAGIGSYTPPVVA